MCIYVSLFKIFWMYLREHPQKTFNTLRGFSLFKRMVVVVVVVLEVGGKGG